MSKVAVVFWSGTGNTEAMANHVADIAKADVFTASSFNKSMVADYSAFAFGCPSMGAEELEDSEFLPMWEDVKSELAGKNVVLFGSYGWGDGEWMRNWAEDCAGTVLGTVTFCGEPDDDAKAAVDALIPSLVG